VSYVQHQTMHFKVAHIHVATTSVWYKCTTSDHFKVAHIQEHVLPL
jgi:hypothetical protein